MSDEDIDEFEGAFGDEDDETDAADFEEAFEMGAEATDDGGDFDEAFTDEGSTEQGASEHLIDLEDRVDLGIGGLDEMIRGGVPEGATLCVIGGPGAGKTTFGMQFVAQGLRNGENCVYFTLEQDKSDIVSTGDDKGWGFSEYTGDSLAVIQMHPIEVASSLRSIRNELPRMISEFGASRVVFDSITLIEMMFQDRAEGRNQIFRFLEDLGEAGATTLVTSEADEEDPYSSRYGVVEYLSDAVFVLQYIRTDSSSETRLALEITKIRDTSHSREVKPYELTDEGIVVYSGATIF
jgi:KaiC domain protein